VAILIRPLAMVVSCLQGQPEALTDLVALQHAPTVRCTHSSCWRMSCSPARPSGTLGWAWEQPGEARSSGYQPLQHAASGEVCDLLREVEVLHNDVDGIWRVGSGAC
jgi:hypothetical protein